MNQSPSRFRTLLQNKSITKKHRVALFVSATALLVVISCQLRNSVTDPIAPTSQLPQPSAPKAESKENASGLTSFFTGKPTFLTVYHKKDASFISAFEVQGSWCSTDAAAGPIRWRMVIDSVVGTFPVTFETPAGQVTPGKWTSKVQIDGRSFDFSEFQTPSQSLKDALCKSAGSDSTVADANAKIVLSDDDLKTVRGWLHAASPDCAFTVPTEKGWSCHLPSADPLMAENALNGISKTLVEKWNRQPYLFTRRLMVSTTLARALMSSNSKNALDRFCRVLALSLPQEVPLAFDSARWRKAVCGEPSAQRNEIAAIGLAKAHSELAFLKLLLERTSTLGTLTVRVPRDKAPEGELLVSLSPAKEVTDALVAESARIWSKEGVLAKTDEEEDEEEDGVKPQHQPLPMACWHPMFGESIELIKLAKYLSLSGNASGIACGADLPQEKGIGKFMAPERYIAESIASETEFAITNGKSKVLRLPQGTYSYIIYGASDATDEGDVLPENKSSGSIVWSKKGPRPLINSWQ